MAVSPTTTPSLRALLAAIGAFLDAAEVRPEGDPNTYRGVPYAIDLVDVGDSIVDLRRAYLALNAQRSALIHRLLELRESYDVEMAHAEADKALLAYIGDMEITQAHGTTGVYWYAQPKEDSTP